MACKGGNCRCGEFIKPCGRGYANGPCTIVNPDWDSGNVTANCYGTGESATFTYQSAITKESQELAGGRFPRTPTCPERTDPTASILRMRSDFRMVAVSLSKGDFWVHGGVLGADDIVAISPRPAFAEGLVPELFKATMINGYIRDTWYGPADVCDMPKENMTLRPYISVVERYDGIVPVGKNSSQHHVIKLDPIVIPIPYFPNIFERTISGISLTNSTTHLYAIDKMWAECWDKFTDFSLQIRMSIFAGSGFTPIAGNRYNCGDDPAFQARCFCNC